MAEATESALIVRMPHPVAVIDDLRDQLDPAAAWGVPAHVTVLYPFVPPASITAVVLNSLATAFSAVAPFTTAFTDTGWFGAAVLWLEPEPAEGFRALTRAATDAFPGFPPYGGAHDIVMPHLTVGEGANHAALREAETRVMPALPLSLDVATVELWCGRPEPRSWTRRATFRLGAGLG